MAKKTPASKSVFCPCCHSPNKDCNCGDLFRAKGFIVLIFGLALWMGLLNLETTIAVLLVLAGLKYLLMPVLWGK